MKISTVTAAILSAALLLFVTPVVSQGQAPKCGSYAQIAEELSQRYQEQPIFQGFFQDRTILEIWMSEEKESWTALRVSPQGVACFLADGKNPILLSLEAESEGS